MRWRRTDLGVGTSAAMALTPIWTRCRSGCSPTGCSRKLEGAVTSAMVHLGDRLGLYRALADADAPLTTTELADRARAATSAGCGSGPTTRARPTIVQIDGDERLSPHARGGGGARRRRPPGLRAWAASTTFPADHGGCSSACPRASAPGSGSTTTPTAPSAPRASPAASSRGCAPTSCPTVLPAARRRRGQAPRRCTRSLDVGCGAGGMVVLVLAAAFPASRVTGYDISQHALDLARERQAEAGVTNVVVRRPAARTRCPTDGSVGLRRHVRLPARHDRPGRRWCRRSVPRSPTTAPGSSSTSRLTTPSPRTSSATRWPASCTASACSAA